MTKKSWAYLSRELYHGCLWSRKGRADLTWYHQTTHYYINQSSSSSLFQLCQDILILSTGFGVQEHNCSWQIMKRKSQVSNLKFKIQDGQMDGKISSLKSRMVVANVPQTNSNFKIKIQDGHGKCAPRQVKTFVGKVKPFEM